MTNCISKFKAKSIRDDFSLQKLVNRSLDLFVYDEEFKKKILEYQNLEERVQNTKQNKGYMSKTKLPKLKVKEEVSKSNKKKYYYCQMT